MDTTVEEQNQEQGKRKSYSTNNIFCGSSGNTSTRTNSSSGIDGMILRSNKIVGSSILETTKDQAPEIESQNVINNGTCNHLEPWLINTAIDTDRTTTFILPTENENNLDGTSSSSSNKEIIGLKRGSSSFQSESLNEKSLELMPDSWESETTTTTTTATTIKSSIKVSHPIDSSINVIDSGQAKNICLRKKEHSVLEKPKRRRLRRPIWDKKPSTIERSSIGRNTPESNYINDNNNNDNNSDISEKLIDNFETINNHHSNSENELKAEVEEERGKRYDAIRSNSPMNISSATNSDNDCLSDNETTVTTTTNTTNHDDGENNLNSDDSIILAESTNRCAMIKNICPTLSTNSYDPGSYGVIEQPEQAQLAREQDDEPNKIFVGGLPWDTTEYDLEFYFSHFGKVLEINIKYDPLSCLTRGFCFVTFASEDTVNLILKKPIHLIKGKLIELKRAKYRPICKKVFVGGLDPRITENDLKTYFSQYGTVVAIESPKDRLRNRKREFCFIIFESELSAERACLYPKQFIGQRLCDVKKAQPQPICYQQKRMAQTAGLEMSNTHLAKMLLGESGRSISIPQTLQNANNGIVSESPAGGPSIPVGLRHEALNPVLTPMGTLLYYQTMPPSARSSAITSRVIPVTAAPLITPYPNSTTYTIPAAAAAAAAIDYSPTNSLYTSISANGLPFNTQNGPAPASQQVATAAAVANVADYYLNYYAQAAAYYAQQQQQLQLSLSGTNSTITTTSVKGIGSREPETTAASTSSNSNPNSNHVIIGKPTYNFNDNQQSIFPMVSTRLPSSSSVISASKST